MNTSGQDAGASAVGKTDADPSSNVRMHTSQYVCCLWPMQYYKQGSVSFSWKSGRFGPPGPISPHGKTSGRLGEWS